MRILKQGFQNRKVKKFSCKNCGCEFEADNTEYQTAGQIAYQYDGTTATCKCPGCGRISNSYDV